MNKKIFENFKYLFKYNLSTLIIFELFHKGLAILAILPFINVLIDLSIYQADLVYLLPTNLMELFKTPLSIILLLLVVSLMVFYVFFEITTVIICIDEGRKDNKIRLFQLIPISFKKSLVILHPRNILLFIFVLIIIPLTNLNFTTGLIIKLKIPEFILDFIYSSTILNIIYIIIIILLYILVARWIFSIYEITLNTNKFSLAIKESFKVTKKKIVKIIIYAITLFIITYLIGLLIHYVGIIVIGLFTKFTSLSNHPKEIFIFRCVLFIDFISFAASIFIFLINITFFLTLYYNYKEIPICKNHKDKEKKYFVKRIVKFIMILIIVQIEANEFSLNNEDLFSPKVFNNTTAIAHRGGAISAPENTLEAIERAYTSGTNFSEIDIQETKDGELVLTHDSNFKRTTGVNKNVWEVTCDEIKTYDASKYFDDEYVNIKVPTLDETLKFCKDKIKLIVEIKLHGHEKGNVTKKVIDLIEKHKMTKECLIGSLDTKVLKEAKKINPNIGTCYITPIAYGSFYDLDYIDVYAIESTFVDKEVVERAHESKKQIFVWTINKLYGMNEMIDLGVDSVITDAPSLMLDALYGKENSFIRVVAGYFFGNDYKEMESFPESEI